MRPVAGDLLIVGCGPAAWPLQVSWPQSLCQRDARSSDCDGCHTARPADSRFLPGQAVSGNVGKFIVAGQAHAFQVLCCAVAAQGELAGVGRRTPICSSASRVLRALQRGEVRGLRALRSACTERTVLYEEARHSGCCNKTSLPSSTTRKRTPRTGRSRLHHRQLLMARSEAPRSLQAAAAFNRCHMITMSTYFSPLRLRKRRRCSACPRRCSSACC